VPNQSELIQKLNSKEVHQLFLEEIDKLSKANGLHGFEFVKAIYVTPEQFTVENDLLTPTFKLKRPQATTFFQSQIDEMYANLPE